MIRHHPGDDLLLQRAAGSLPVGAAVVVGVHVEACAECRARLHMLQAVGGALLESLEPAVLAPDALARTLERIALAPEPPPAQAPTPQRTALPGGRAWPSSLAGCHIGPWRWIAPGMRFSRVQVPRATGESLYLLQIAPGRGLASHSHSKLELTQVLCGRFDDGRSSFGPGDFDATDPDVHHRPVVGAGETCVCLAYVEGHLEFDSRLAGMVGRWIGM